MQASLPTADEVSRALERAYARPALGPRPRGLTDPIRDALGRAWRWFTGLFDRLPGFDGDSVLLDRLLIVALLVAAAGIVAYLLHQTLGRLGDGPAAAGGGRSGDDEGARARSRPEWEAFAARLAAQGRFREAAMALYLALLLRLEHVGALRYDPAKTPGDYRREARPHPQGRRLGAFLRLFEPVAFGGRPIGAEGYDRLRAALAAEGPDGAA